MDATQLGKTLGTLLTLAWLLPLAGFTIEIFGGFWGSRKSKAAAYLAVACIVGAFVFSGSALLLWKTTTGWSLPKSSHGETTGHGSSEHAVAAGEHHDAPAHAEDPVHDKDEQGQAQGGHPAANHTAPAGAPKAEASSAYPKYYSGTIYVLAEFRKFRLAIDYHIDTLTLTMFTMVTFIASIIHIFAIGYMSDELTDHHEDHEVHTSHGHFVRPGRFYRFFAFLSLFSFSMLGLVLAGNVFMVFIFWELVGVCSYFLIGFYVERKSASTAANKAFIMNRVGDFGFLIGLMIIFSYFGTFQFASRTEEDGTTRPGLFDILRDEDGAIKLSANGDTVFLNEQTAATDDSGLPVTKTIPYFLLLTAGLGIFAGCIGKSAQFPLQTWLPDAMEGPTPVSALVHSATMVAAGVYLAGRFYPMFVPEVLLVIAYIGCITLFLAATIAIVATDIKKVLAYSTISQLGYMMLGIGVGGWSAGLFHLITHAFFKSLMFLASGSVIYGCHHVQEMPRMGGLRKKMPITAYTMLVGVIAIAGLAIPIPDMPIAFSGYYSKDAIVATAMTYAELNRSHFLLFIMPLAGAGITAFYMFRLWFYTFAGAPRDHHVYEHAHETPAVMTVPLLVLAVLAAFCAWGGEDGYLFQLLTASQPAGVAEGLADQLSGLNLPSHDQIHKNHENAGYFALLVAGLGAFTAYLFYGKRLFDPADVKRQLSGLHTFLVEKWWFDELYDVMFVRPSHIVARWCAAFDRVVFDGFLHFLARFAVTIAKWDRTFDEQIVDGFVNRLGEVTFSTGRVFGYLQTGRLRQYVTFIVVGVVGIWLLVQFFSM